MLAMSCNLFISIETRFVFLNNVPLCTTWWVGDMVSAQVELFLEKKPRAGTKTKIHF